MARRISEEQRQHEIKTVERALLAGEWMRPCVISATTGLTTAVVLSALRMLQQDHAVGRREYVIERLHQGRDRTRKTSRLIVEYKRISREVKFPAWLMPPAPRLKGRRRLVTFGEAT